LPVKFTRITERRRAVISAVREHARSLRGNFYFFFYFAYIRVRVCACIFLFTNTSVPLARERGEITRTRAAGPVFLSRSREDALLRAMTLIRRRRGLRANNSHRRRFLSFVVVMSEIISFRRLVRHARDIAAKSKTVPASVSVASRQYR